MYRMIINPRRKKGFFQLTGWEREKLEADLGVEKASSNWDSGSQAGGTSNPPLKRRASVDLNINQSGSVLSGIPNMRDLPFGKWEEKRRITAERKRLAREVKDAGSGNVPAKNDPGLLESVGLGRSAVVQWNVYKPLPSEELERITGGQIVDAHGEWYMSKRDQRLLELEKWIRHQ
jgi:hypothetical protein